MTGEKTKHYESGWYACYIKLCIVKLMNVFIEKS